MKKVVFTILVLIVLVSICTTVTKASDIDTIMKGAENFLKEGQTAPTEVVIKKENVTDVMNFVYNTLLIIGTVVVIIVGSILGIKYMTSSVEGQAKIKETLIPFVVGCVVIFGSFFIWKMIVNILTGLE